MHDDNPTKDVIAGAIGGLAATAAVALFMQLSKPLTGIDPAAPDAAGEPRIGSPEAATRVVEEGLGHSLPDDRKEAASGLFQFAFGTALGAGYGLIARYLPLATAGRGTLFGTGVFAVADEVLVPATGLSGKPADSPAEAHGGALAVHLLFGLVAESVRRAVLRR
jgi:putative membrane protein